MKMNFNNKKLIQGFTVMSSIALIASIFSLYFIRLEKYDIKVTTWSDYITQENINDFNDESSKHIKLNEFNNNEIMMVKSLTTSYDLYAPTDYAIHGLYDLDKIQKIDYARLEGINSDATNQSFLQSSSQRRFVDEWYDLASIYELDAGINLIDYAIPFIMGDFKIVLNMQSSIIQQMINDNSINAYCDGVDLNDLNSVWSCSYDVIPSVVKSGGTFVMGNNPRDVMALGLKANGKSLNDASDASLNIVKDWYADIIDGIKFQNNELGVTIADPNGWDVAYAFPGDPVLGLIDEWNWDGDYYWHDVAKFATPREGANLWYDAFTISKNSKDLEATYEFIEFMTRDIIQLGYFENEGIGSHLYGGLEFIYYQTPSRLVQEKITLDPEERTASDFFMDDYVIMIDTTKQVDLYNQALHVHAYDDLEWRNKNLSCTLNNSCGTNGKGAHEFAVFDQEKQNKFVRYFNLILAMQS